MICTPASTGGCGPADLTEPRRPPSPIGARHDCAARERANDAALIEQSWHEPEAFAELYDRHAVAMADRPTSSIRDRDLG
jgi:hypothetical protein